MTTPQKPSRQTAPLNAAPLDTPPLDTVQRWMQSVITHPQGAKAGLQSTAASSHLDVSPNELEQVIDPSIAQTSLERLGIYASAYHARLIECLEAEYPIFRQTVGDDAFADFAFEYLRQHPSSSYTLGQLGSGFPQFLEQTKPQPADGAASPDGTVSRDWPDLLVDLARLERTFSEVFDGPGVENVATLSADAISSLDPNSWPQARLIPVPCLRLLSLRFPLNNYYSAMKNGQQPPLPTAADSWVAITRRDFVVRRYPLNHAQFVLLDTLCHDNTIGDAIAAAANVYPGHLDSLAADLRNWFETWTAAPLFLEVKRN